MEPGALIRVYKTYDWVNGVRLIRVAPFYCDMAEVDEPIIRGALYEDNHGDLIRVRNVWVDENLATQVSVQVDNVDRRGEERETIPLQQFVEEINHSLFRDNSDHDAWEWRERSSQR